MNLPANTPSTRSCLAFYVVDRITRTPVVGAAVQVYANENKTDLLTNGTGLAVVPLYDVSLSFLEITVKKEGFVPRRINWNVELPGFQVPTNFTLEMNAGQCIGGIVQNEEGLPIVGTKAVLLNSRLSTEDEPCYSISDGVRKTCVVTSKDGKWEFPEAPPDLSELLIVLEHPDYISNEHFYPLPPLEAFQKKTAILVQKRGVPCEGTVIDVSGEPIANCTVLYGDHGFG